MVAWMRARGVRVLLARLRVPSATVWQRCWLPKAPHALQQPHSTPAQHVPQARWAGKARQQL